MDNVLGEAKEKTAYPVGELGVPLTGPKGRRLAAGSKPEGSNMGSYFRPCGSDNSPRRPRNSSMSASSTGGSVAVASRRAYQPDSGTADRP